VAVLLTALIAANLLKVAADLVAISSGMNLLHAGPVWIWALVAAGVITVLLIMGSYARIALVFKFRCLSLLVYVVVMVLVTHYWGHLIEYTLIPHVQFSRSFIAPLVAILGTTISPYLFFWQSANRLEEMRDEPEGGDDPTPLRENGSVRGAFKQRTSRFDVFSGMAFSNIVMFAIIATTAETLHTHHVTHIQSAAQAAQALKPLAGASPATSSPWGSSVVACWRFRFSPRRARWGCRDSWARTGAFLARYARCRSSTCSWFSGPWVVRHSVS